MTSPQPTIPLKAGEKAPEFTLSAYKDGEKCQISLSDFHGQKNVILAFYPKDDTPGCTREMCGFSEELQKFQALDAEILGISCDKMERHEKFAGKYSLKQALLADDNGKVGRAYGTVDDGKSTASRVLFLIDKEGIIKHVVTGMPDHEKLYDLLKTL